MINLANDFFLAAMSYTAASYYVLIACCFILYFLMPKRFRWISLLLSSCLFYYLASGKDLKAILLFISTIGFSYIAGIFLEKYRNKRFFILMLIISISPLLLVKGNVFIFKRIHAEGLQSLIVPLGLSFYSLQIYAYLYDIYDRKIEPQRNFFKYAPFHQLFSTDYARANPKV